MRAHLKSAVLAAFCLLASVAVAQTKPVVVFIATGGTIAMKIDPVRAWAGATSTSRCTPPSRTRSPRASPW